MRVVRAPVPAMLLIEVEHFARELVGERAHSRCACAAAFEADADVVFAEDVAEVRADAPADSGAE